MRPNPSTFITATRRRFIGAMAASAAVAGLGEMVVASPSQSDEPVIAHGDGPEPTFHGPRIVGGTPGKPFLFKVPFTGNGSVTLNADNLPEGLRMTGGGIITGLVPHAGEYRVALSASSVYGKTARTLEIISGKHKLAQTPPMGWNSWNAWNTHVTEDRVKQAAELMVNSRLAAKGYRYIIVDAGWQGSRDREGNIRPNAKFPGGMKALGDFIHARGLQFGIYSSPGPTDCCGYVGSYGHEQQDARTYAQWGVDYLKYDLCSYWAMLGKNPTAEALAKPYTLMRRCLDAVDRDIVYSLCEYGLGDVWKWGGDAPVYGNLARISWDIRDNWASIVYNGFHSDRELSSYAGPGHWNDPDMLVVGWLGWGNNNHPSRLTPHEKMTHVTLWCMLAAPLILGCDLGKLDQFTLDLLSNPEVIAVDQDELGRQAQCVLSTGQVTVLARPPGQKPVSLTTGERQVWARQLSDNTVAVALFNLGPNTEEISVKWSDLLASLDPGLQLDGPQPVRDLWKRKDLGRHDGFFCRVASHGAALIKIGVPHNS
ncbi:MAG: glycoside hydrolase family 27 protein [Phycisphaerae bacterium]